MGPVWAHVTEHSTLHQNVDWIWSLLGGDGMKEGLCPPSWHILGGSMADEFLLLFEIRDQTSFCPFWDVVQMEDSSLWATSSGTNPDFVFVSPRSLVSEPSDQWLSLSLWWQKRKLRKNLVLWICRIPRSWFIQTGCVCEYVYICIS